MAARQHYTASLCAKYKACVFRVQQHLPKISGEIDLYEMWNVEEHVSLTYNADCYLSVCRHTGREWECFPESGCYCLGKGYTGYKCEFLSLAKTSIPCYGMVFSSRYRVLFTSSIEFWTPRHKFSRLIFLRSRRPSSQAAAPIWRFHIANS